MKAIIQAYILKIIVWNKKQNNNPRYDYLRVIATLFVIVTHTLQVEISENAEIPRIMWNVMTIAYVFAMSCNCIYVMLSGATLIPGKQKNIIKFYYKRAVRVMIPMLVYYFFYQLAMLRANHFSIDSIQLVLGNLLTGNTPETPHYWILYVILGIYLLIPVWHILVSKMSYSRQTILAVVIMIFMCLNVTPFMPRNSIVSVILWSGMAYMGYWISRIETRKWDSLLYVMGITAFLSMIALIMTKKDFIEICCNCSPIMTSITLAIWALILRKEKIFGNDYWLIRLLSKYSYSMILIHWWVLHWVTRARLHIYAVSWFGTGTIISVMTTMAVSFIMGFIIENLIVDPIQFVLKQGLEAIFDRNTDP